jgi:hypothetical protein
MHIYFPVDNPHFKKKKKGYFPGGFFMAIQQKGWMHQIHSRFEKRNASQAETVVSR